MTRTGRMTATALAVGAATIGLSGVASATEDGDHGDHGDRHRDHGTTSESGDAHPGVLTGVGNLVGGILNTDLVGNVLDGVF